MSRSSSAFSTREIAFIALFVALITVCAWISIPFAVPFTLQTFAIFAALGLLGGKRATIAVAVYLLLGAIGLPVFAGFTGGIGRLAGATGGYLVGFLLSAIIGGWILHRFGRSTPVLILAMIAGLAVCYVFGTAWFMILYARTTGPVGLTTVLGWCVIPFLLPDAAKIALAVLLTRRLEKYTFFAKTPKQESTAA